MEMSRGCLGVSEGCRRVSECYFRKLEALRCGLGSQPLQYGAITLFWHSPERHDFFHLTIVRHQNIKMFIYEVDKSDWVI